MKRLITFFSLIAFVATTASAYDFEEDGLCYYKNSDGVTVTVTYQNTSSPRYSNLSGALNIPPSVTHSGVTYEVTSIGYQAFSGCSGFESIEIPNSVTSIGDSAFSDCSGLTSVTIPNSVTWIGLYAFYNCSGLTSVTIGNSVTSIGSYAFQYCSGLTKVEVSDLAAWCRISFGSSESNPLYYAKHLYLNGSEIKDLVIPNSVKKICKYAFRGCSGLTSVTIPNSVTSIESSAFSSCSGLTSVTIPNSVTSIESSAFSSCSGLTKVEISDLDAWCRISFNSTLANPLYYAHHLYLNGSEITNLVIPSTISTIRNYTFQYCSGITSVTIPNSVTFIGGDAFSGCSGLKTVNWNVKNCAVFPSGSSPFSGSTGINTFSFGNEVQNIPAYLCYGLSGLTSVTISNLVSSIGISSFGGCNNIQDLVWNAKNCASMGDMPKTNISSVTIGDGVEILPNNFVENSKITTVTIPNSVTTIGASAFSGCSGLPSVEIPNSTTSIGASAFADCRLIQHVTIGSNVNAIGDNAFKNCKYLIDVTNYSVIPQEINANVFDGIDLSLCYLYVLENSYNYYIREAVWKDFNVRISGVEGVEVDAATKEVEGYYDLNGIRFEEPIRGQVNIVRYKDGTSQKIVVK